METSVLYIPPNKRFGYKLIEDICLIPPLIDDIEGHSDNNVSSIPRANNRSNMIDNWKKNRLKTSSMTPEQASWQNRNYMDLKSLYTRYCGYCCKFGIKSVTFDFLASTIFKLARNESLHEMSIDYLNDLVKGSSSLSTQRMR